MNQLMDITLDNVICQVEGNIVSDMNGEKVMFSVKKGKYYNLGTTGGEIWDYTKEEISIQELVHKLVELYEVGQQECEEQTISFIQHLVKEGLLQVKK
ncbi:lasso peptide biosynthesis PqqD family chaperone [Evansella sp. AB-rgal1]|uniref:lasso peptide biosynthesis PqqD family chaperone n=1 Tax=Evansella sp. AB-rgal1 TaxID=3242696 RepID=UPI00359D257C